MTLRRPGLQAPARRMVVEPAPMVTVLEDRRRQRPRVRSWWMMRRREDSAAIEHAISDYEESSLWGRPAGGPKLDVIVRFQRWARWFRKDGTTV